MDIMKKMHNKELYFCDDQELFKKQTEQLEILYDFNNTRPKESNKRNDLLKKLFAEIGENCYIEPPLHTNWGKNVHFGNNVYANFNLTLVDDTHIYVGDNVLFAPNVIIATASHPINPDLRKPRVGQFNLPVKIGNNVWIGSGGIVLPGVCIGDNSVIGAGSVVTKDIPSNVVAFGNPCKVIRVINENDKKYYYRNLKN